MPATIDLTEAQVFQALRTVLLGVLATNIEVVRGQTNRVPPPAGSDYVVLTPLLRQPLAVPVQTWDETNPNPTSVNLLTPLKAVIQIDVHGPASADNAAIIAGVLRSQYGYAQFAATGFAVQPLYVQDPRQIPFVDGAQQVEERWVIDAELQVNPNITLTQDFADALTIGLVEIDARYPP